MILSYDFGTSVLKAALFEEDGRFQALVRQPLRAAGTAADGHYEADAEGWITALKSVTAELLEGADVKRLRAAVICGNGPTLVPVDAAGNFLKPVMTWMDRRAAEQSDRIGSVQDFKIDSSFYFPKAMWIADNLPEIYNKTRYFLSCPEAVAFRLTGEALTVLPGVRFEKYFWNDELFKKTGIDKSKFPDFVKPGTIAGRVAASAADETGLPAGLPVVSAGPDFAVSLLGTAAVKPGRACDRSGTSEGINLCTEDYIEDPRLMGYGHIVEPWFNMSGIISTSGKAVEWLRDGLYRQGAAAGRDRAAVPDIDAFTASAAGVKAGADRLLFLPYLAGERAPHWDPAARGAFLGLGLGHGAAEMTRAVLESTGFAMRDVIEVMAENGGRVEDLRITGGPSRNRLWNSIKADITGRRLLVPESAEAELLGNLVLALPALGDADSLAETADRLVKIKEVYEPDAANRGIYDDMFGLYRESYKQLRGLFSALGSAGESAGN